MDMGIISAPRVTPVYEKLKSTFQVPNPHSHPNTGSALGILPNHFMAGF